MSFAPCCTMKLMVLASLMIVQRCSAVALGLGALGAGSAAVAGTTAATGSAATTGAAAAGTAATGTAVAAGGAPVVSAAAGNTAAAVSTAGAGSLFASVAETNVLLMAGGITLLTVGAEADASAVTWDCWKPILHERSTAPSRGRLLMDILNDPVISDYRVDQYSAVVRNRWNESWRIDPLILPWGEVAAHASQIASFPTNLSASLSHSMNVSEALEPQLSAPFDM